MLATYWVPLRELPLSAVHKICLYIYYSRTTGSEDVRLQKAYTAASVLGPF
jgi:hypothetical protein